MKTTRMTVEGARGEATLSRVEDRIRIEAKYLARFIETPKRDVPVFETAIWEVAADSQGSDGRFERNARRLQATLDGYEGTAGDVADYLRAIQTFAD